jgi:hypothetical protein
MNDAKYIGMDVHQATISVAVRDSRDRRRTSETTSSLSVGLEPSFAGFISGDGFSVLLTLWFEGESPLAR